MQQRENDIHTEAVQRLDDIISTLFDERRQCLDDRRFCAVRGAQWEGSIGQQFQNKPRIEVNKVQLAVTRIINEYRANRVTVDFIPKSENANDALADACDGLFRADEQDSCAEEAYDNGFDEGVSGGMGAWRLIAVEDEDSEEEHQKIRIEPIYEADSCVFFDLDAKRQDKSDSKYCFVLFSITRDAAEKEYGDAPSSFGRTISRAEFEAFGADILYLAEYYVIESKKEKFIEFMGFMGDKKRVPVDADQDEIAELEATGFSRSGTVSIKTKKVHKYIISADRILDDAGYIAGKNIPIVPFYGKRWFIEGIERIAGHVRTSRDPQILANANRSKMLEFAGASSIDKPIFTPEQMAGHQNMWSQDNIINYPYMLINPITDINGNTLPSGPVAYTKSPDIPQAIAALLQISEQDMIDVLGNQQSLEEVKQNVSGVALEIAQGRIDMQSFIYMTNMAKAIKRTGEIWLSMAKEVYVEDGRQMKVLGQQNERGFVELGRPTYGPSGQIENEIDLSRAEFDVAVDVGPTSQSKRAAIVRAISGLLPLVQDQELQQILAYDVMMNLEGEGLSEFREYFHRQLVAKGVIKPTKEEAAALAAQAEKPDPQAQFLQASSAKALADAKLADAKVEETIAKAAKTIADISLAERQQVIDLISTLESRAAVSGSLQPSALGG